MNNHLPYDQHLDISSFARIFEKTTNSYKYLFFLALIRKVNEVGKSELEVTEIKQLEIAVELLLLSWFPHRYFRLSFGVQDQCANILKQFVDSQGQVFENGPITDATVGRLRMNLAEWLEKNNVVLRRLLKYVPFRLLSPFFVKELKGIEDSKKNQIIKKLANDPDRFPPSPYGFDDECFLVYGRWRDYIQKNYPIIEGWAKWQWCTYLQAKNPAVPSIPNKILPIFQRVQMTKEKNYWQDILKYRGLRCIYSNIELKSFELDHFLPWTFVTHNQPWNLIPVSASANSSKSNSLPSLVYLDTFIKEQSAAINVASKIYKQKKWEKIMEPYLADLKISNYGDLLNDAILDKAFRGTLLPLYEIASMNGFNAGWEFKQDAEIISVSSKHNPFLIYEPDDRKKYNSLLPYYPIRIAAGGFADSEATEVPEFWVDVSRLAYSGVVTKDLFVSQVHGQSMEPSIPDGSYCLFRFGVNGNRTNRVLLVKKDGIIDPDQQTSFTIKRYFSEKKSDQNYGWTHKKIELRPDNPEFNVIIVEPSEADDFSVVAEFLQVLDFGNVSH